MADDVVSTSPTATSNSSAVDKQELSRELQMVLEIRPYILKCLSLNHDINNPLAGIIGYGEILSEEESLTPEQKGYLNQIMTCAERIRAKINELCEEKIALQGQLDLREVVELLSKGKPG